MSKKDGGWVVLPEGWEEKTLGDAFIVGHGQGQRSIETVSGKYPILATGGEIGRTNTFLYDKPSVLIGRKGTIDKPQYVDKPFWTIDTLFYTIIKSEYSPKFLYYICCKIDWKQYNEASGVPSLSSKTIESIKVLLPPLPEQRAIAAALSDADSYISALEKLIAKKRNIKQGAMQELLRAKEGWEEKPLGKCALDIRTGKKNNEQKSAGGKYPFFVRSQQIEHIDTYSYDGEAVIIPGEGNIGQIFHYINGKFDFHQRVYKISDFADDICGKYIFYQLKHSFGKYALANTVKATVDSLRLPTFENFIVQLPPLPEQTRIAAILSDMDAEIDALTAKLHKAKLIKQGMMQQLLTGKIRLEGK
ncbi:MAG: restriction endonuclease subunit S [Termitinemataceae bacterium]|nr:MAG: restriction endonuclease subunit S [Termitinemataceae bacterium]